MKRLAIFGLLLVTSTLAGCSDRGASPPFSSSETTPAVEEPVDNLAGIHLGDSALYSLAANGVNGTVLLEFLGFERVLQADLTWHDAVVVRVNSSWSNWQGEAVREPGSGKEFQLHPPWEHRLALEYPRLLNSLKIAKPPTEPCGCFPTLLDVFPSDVHPAYMPSVDSPLFALLPTWHFGLRDLSYQDRSFQITQTVLHGGSRALIDITSSEPNFGRIDIQAELDGSPFATRIQATFQKGDVVPRAVNWTLDRVDQKLGMGQEVPFKGGLPASLAALPRDGHFEYWPAGQGRILAPPMDVQAPQSLNLGPAFQHYLTTRGPVTEVGFGGERMLVNVWATSFEFMLPVIQGGGVPNPQEMIPYYQWMLLPTVLKNGEYASVNWTAFHEIPTPSTPAFEPWGSQIASFTSGGNGTYSDQIPLVRLSSIMTWMHELNPRNQSVDSIQWWLPRGHDGTPGAWVVTLNCGPNDIGGSTTIAVDTKTGLLMGAMVDRWPGGNVDNCGAGDLSPD